MGIGLILFGFLVFFLSRHFENPEEEQGYTLQELNETETDISGAGSENTAAEGVDFEISGISEDIYALLQITEPELEALMQEWTMYHGYSACEGAVFYAYMEMDPLEEKYSLTAVLLMGEDDDREGEILITLDFYKASKEYVFHP